jgi:hypothetical protein
MNQQIPRTVRRLAGEIIERLIKQGNLVRPERSEG